MKKATLLLSCLVAFVVVPAVDVFAHGGGTDACGGHHNRKRGGYHVHKYAKYCNCYPEAAECRPVSYENTQSKKNKTKSHTDGKTSTDKETSKP